MSEGLNDETRALQDRKTLRRELRKVCFIRRRVIIRGLPFR